MTYQTTPGTIPHRVVEYLRTLPPGTRVSQAEIGEALGQPGIDLSSYCAHAIAAGLIGRASSVGRGNRATYWLGDGAPAEDPEPAVDHGAVPFVHRLVPASLDSPLDMAFWASGGLIFKRGGVEFPIAASEAAAVLEFIGRVARGIAG